MPEFIQPLPEPEPQIGLDNLPPEYRELIEAAGEQLSANADSLADVIQGVATGAQAVLTENQRQLSQVIRRLKACIKKKLQQNQATLEPVLRTIAEYMTTQLAENRVSLNLFANLLQRANIIPPPEIIRQIQDGTLPPTYFMGPAPGGQVGPPVFGGPVSPVGSPQPLLSPSPAGQPLPGAVPPSFPPPGPTPSLPGTNVIPGGGPTQPAPGGSVSITAPPGFEVTPGGLIIPTGSGPPVAPVGVGGPITTPPTQFIGPPLSGGPVTSVGGPSGGLGQEPGAFPGSVPTVGPPSLFPPPHLPTPPPPPPLGVPVALPAPFVLPGQPGGPGLPGAGGPAGPVGPSGPAGQSIAGPIIPVVPLPGQPGVFIQVSASYPPVTVSAECKPYPTQGTQATGPTLEVGPPPEQGRAEEPAAGNSSFPVDLDQPGALFTWPGDSEWRDRLLDFYGVAAFKGTENPQDRMDAFELTTKGVGSPYRDEYIGDGTTAVPLAT